MAEAAEATAKTMLGEISQGHLECPICFCRYKDPKILDCLHTFCLNCLDGMLSKQQPSTGKITCPVCRKETPVPDAGLPGLLDCFFLSSLVDEINQQERSLETQQQATTSPTCDACEEGLEVVSRCIDCEENLCQLCKAAHVRYKRTKTHRVTPVEHPEQKEVPSADLSKTYSPKCQKHSNQEMYFYCETCKMMTCGICATIDHRSAEHQLSEITDAVRSYREEVNDVLKKFQKSKEEFKANEAAVDHARNRLKIMVTRACSAIQAKEEEDIAQIKNKSRILRDKVTEIGKKRDDEFDKVHTDNKKKMERAEEIETAVTDLMQQADDFELLNLKPKVMHNLEFQKNLQFERVKHGESFIGFKCQDVVRDKDLGEILHEEKWKLQSEFGKKGDWDGEFNCAAGIACFSNGDIAVNDINKKRLSVFTSTGHYKSMFDLNAPYGITVTSHDLLLAHCEDHVKVFDKSHQLISKFNLPLTGTDSTDQCFISPWSNNKTYTSGITVDKTNQVALVDKKTGVTSLHSLDGSLIRVIPNTKMVPIDIITNKKRCILSAMYDESELRCVDVTGKVNVTARLGQARPAGVCCDDTGDIYVTVHGNGLDKGVGEVLHFDPQGVFIGCVARAMHWPFGITFSPSGELVVADYYSVKIFHRV
ncbi:E3 ubiquitin-protein ligase TRIM71-like [Patiria miniata]|uniref:Tripartite motif-containing protein 2-like n=1 Tax=Patiria miniata TaxID=46514 RepID=A0A913ZM87_PATMI|nr:E3 ubiquitin-protein ligase TRIM71-like [Patiria miniata]